MEHQRLSPWATLAPDLAGRLDQLVDSVGHLAEAVSQQQGNMQAGAEQQTPMQQQAAAAGLAAAQPPQAATARADERSPRSSKAQVVPALYSSKVKMVDDAVQVRCHGWRWNAAACIALICTRHNHSADCIRQLPCCALLSIPPATCSHALTCSRLYVQEYYYGIGMAEPVVSRVQQVKATSLDGSGGRQPQGALQEQVAAGGGGHGDPDAGQQAVKLTTAVQQRFKLSLSQLPESGRHLQGAGGGAQGAVTGIVPVTEKQAVQLADVRAALVAEQLIDA